MSATALDNPSAAAAPAMQRYDGRSPAEMRGKELRTGELATFDGSVYYSQGQTAIVVSLSGPVAARLEDYRRCLVEVRIVRSRAIPPAGGASRLNQNEMQRALNAHDTELAALAERCVAYTVDLSRYPRCALSFTVDVLSDDGSLASSVLNAMMCAILDAGIACRTSFAAVTVCRLYLNSDSGKAVPGTLSRADGNTLNLLDPTKMEEDNGVEEINTGSGAAQSSSKATIGTFVFASPFNGGGVLGSTVRTRTFPSEKDGEESDEKTAAHNGDESGSKQQEQQQQQGSFAAGFSAVAYMEMEQLAERAASTLFEFYRNCGVPAESD